MDEEVIPFSWEESFQLAPLAAGYICLEVGNGETRAPIGGVWCLMNCLVMSAKQKAFRKKRQIFQTGALRLLMPPR
jgi:hypothetical protein